MLEKIVAALVLAAVVLAWLGMALGPARRRRWLAWPRRLWRQLRARRVARREAADIIERARRKPVVKREGNVIRPKSFERRRRGDADDNDQTLH